LKRKAELLLSADFAKIDEILKNGHDWAEDHIAAATENVTQVTDFFMNELKETGSGVKPGDVGTTNEAEKLVYDELGPELESLRSKISNLMKDTTDKKWATALGQALTALSNLDRNLSNADSKLGVIPVK
jgi:hypothetical protein